MIEQSKLDTAIEQLQESNVDTSNQRTLFSADTVKKITDSEEFVVALLELLKFLKVNIVAVNIAAGVKWYEIHRWYLSITTFKELLKLVIKVINSLIKQN